MLKEGLFKRVRNKLALSLDEIDNKARIRKLAEIINENKSLPKGKRSFFFNASTRLSRLSLNAGFRAWHPGRWNCKVCPWCILCVNVVCSHAFWAQIARMKDCARPAIPASWSQKFCLKTRKA